MRKTVSGEKKHTVQRDRATALLALLFIAALVISILPMLYLSFFDYANGDDFNYGYMTHQTWLHTGSVLAVLQSACTVVKNTWYSWQGTWSSVFLFSLQPGIWKERVYGLTVWIALFCILGGTYYFLYVILRRRIQMTMPLFLILWSLLEILTLQFMPNIKTAVFWYTSVAHYMIPFGAALFVLGWAVQWLDSGKKRYFIGILILMSYLGGAGYPLVALAGAGVFFIMVCYFLLNRAEHEMKRGLSLLIPLALEAAGFAVSAAAPGNRNRGGEDFGFSGSRAVNTIAEGFVNTGKDIVSYIARPELLIPILVIAVFAWFIYQPDKAAAENKKLLHPAVFAILLFIMTAAVRMPALYAAVDVSSGVPDTEFVFTLLALFLSLIYAVCWAKKRRLQKAPKNAADRGNAVPLQNRTLWICLLTVAFLLGTVVITRHSLKNTSDYLCIDFIRSGRLSDFEAQMQERLAILNDDSNPDPVVPEMNNDQGPFMHMALLDDPDSFTNWATRMYYGKNSVIAVPRDEYEKNYK